MTDYEHDPDLTDEQRQDLADFDALDPEFCHYLMEDMNKRGLLDRYKVKAPLDKHLWKAKLAVIKWAKVCERQARRRHKAITLPGHRSRVIH